MALWSEEEQKINKKIMKKLIVQNAGTQALPLKRGMAYYVPFF